MRYYAKGQNVLANCGTKEEPEWIPGVVLSSHCGYGRPYQIKLEQENDGLDTWYFPTNLVINDTRRNRKRYQLDTTP